MVKMLDLGPSLPVLFAVLGRLRLGDDRHVRLLSQSAVVTFVGYILSSLIRGMGGISLFSIGVGSRAHFGRLCHDGAVGAERPSRLLRRGRSNIEPGAGSPVQLIQIEGTIARHLAQLPKARRPGNNVYFISDGGFLPRRFVANGPAASRRRSLLFSRGAVLDAELRQQNWPKAVLVERRFGVEEWNLGPNDQRQVSTDLPGIKRFMFSYSDHAPAGGVSDARPQPTHELLAPVVRTSMNPSRNDAKTISAPESIKVTEGMATRIIVDGSSAARRACAQVSTE